VAAVRCDSAAHRLRAANPFVADPSRGTEPVAQAALQRILDMPAPPSTSFLRREMTPRGLVLVLAVLLIGVGGALAAADPMGWWSSNPSEAHYYVSTGASVRTPTAQHIRCHADGRSRFSCVAETHHCHQIGKQTPVCKLVGSGLPYMQIDTIHAPPLNSILSRAGFKQAIANALAKGTITAAAAAQFGSDLVRVPDSFFIEMRLAIRFGSYGAGGLTRNGKVLVPPAGQPAILVCGQSGSRINCQNMNGDTATPIGAGVYTAVRRKDWRWVNAPRYIGGLPPGIHFSHAEDRVLTDLLRFGATTSGSSGFGHADHHPIAHL
jgi:hypothetical protein